MTFSRLLVVLAAIFGLFASVGAILEIETVGELLAISSCAKTLTFLLHRYLTFLRRRYRDLLH